MTATSTPSTDASAAASPLTSVADVLDRAWEVHPSVAVRPEPFGALLYHFGTRRLSFLKDRRLLDLVQQLPRAATARQACADVGLQAGELRQYASSLATLARTDMIRERT